MQLPGNPPARAYKYPFAWHTRALLLEKWATRGTPTSGAWDTLEYSNYISRDTLRLHHRFEPISGDRQITAELRDLLWEGDSLPMCVSRGGGGSGGVGLRVDTPGLAHCASRPWTVAHRGLLPASHRLRRGGGGRCAARRPRAPQSHASQSSASAPTAS